MILAIVGTRHLSPTAFGYAEVLIIHEVCSGKWDGFVTGDAPGIDAMAKKTCDTAGKPCVVLAPEKRQWQPDGYKRRNTLICEMADAMLCIRDPESTTYGSGWTANYMDTLGKPVVKVEIS